MKEEKKYDYNYLMELFIKWEKEVKLDYNIVFGSEINEISIHECCVNNENAEDLLIDFVSYDYAISWLNAEIQKPTYQDALKFIEDNQVDYRKDIMNYHVYFQHGAWYHKNTEAIKPFIKYMTKEKCEEFMEKFKNVKPVQR